MNFAASVIIPAFNAAKTLGEQLAGLGAQDSGVAFEVLVCDNGSTDSTVDVVRAYEAEHAGIRLVDASARRGAAAARNIGAAAARTPLLLFCDADDVVSPGWVRELYHALQSASFVAGSVEHSLLNPGRDWDFGWDKPTFTDPALPQLPAAGSGNMGVRVGVFADVGGFDESLASAEDLDFSWRVQLAGHKLVPVPSAIVHVRKRGRIRDAMRQAYAKGRGSRMVAHRFALVRQAYGRVAAADSPGEAGGLPSSTGGTSDRLRRLPAKALQVLRSPSHVTPYLAALAYRIGYGRASTVGAHQLEPPDPLPR